MNYKKGFLRLTSEQKSSRISGKKLLTLTGDLRNT